jgi:hypothetical protein
MVEPAKVWDFPKQHIRTHVIDDIYEVGVTRNGSTKPGEGMHQEVRALYAKTNFKDVELQVCALCTQFDGQELTGLLQITRGDANQEVIAHIRRLVDAYDCAEHRRQERLEKEREKLRSSQRGSAGANGDKEQDKHAELSTDLTYVFRSPVGARTTSDDIQEQWGCTRPAFRQFDAELRRFFTSYWPQAPIGDSPIKVSCTHTFVCHDAHLRDLDQGLFAR